jgi:hypothetical protein
MWSEFPSKFMHYIINIYPVLSVKTMLELLDIDESIQLPRTCMMRIITLGEGQIYPPPNSEGLPCDASHIACPYVSNISETKMMELIKRKLPKVNFPVRTGSTGYIIWPETSELPVAGYTLDEIGRTVGVIDGIRFFQRYTGCCMLVSHMGKDEYDYFTSLSEDDKKLLEEKLNNYNP